MRLGIGAREKSFLPDSTVSSHLGTEEGNLIPKIHRIGAELISFSFIHQGNCPYFLCSEQKMTNNYRG